MLTNSSELNLWFDYDFVMGSLLIYELTQYSGIQFEYSTQCLMGTQCIAAWFVLILSSFWLMMMPQNRMEIVLNANTECGIHNDSGSGHSYQHCHRHLHFQKADRQRQGRDDLYLKLVCLVQTWFDYCILAAIPIWKYFIQGIFCACIPIPQHPVYLCPIFRELCTCILRSFWLTTIPEPCFLLCVCNFPKCVTSHLSELTYPPDLHIVCDVGFNECDYFRLLHDYSVWQPHRYRHQLPVGYDKDISRLIELRTLVHLYSVLRLMLSAQSDFIIFNDLCNFRKFQ